MSLKLLKNLLKLRHGGLAIFATTYEIMNHKFTCGNELACPHAHYRIVVEQHVKGKLVGKIAVKTCVACDPGA